MRLIDHVLRHHAAAADTPVNTAPTDWIAANPEVRYSEAETKDPLPEYLTAPEARQLITHLSSARPRPGRNRDALSAMSWQEVRNRTSVALQLGAGLTPGDVRALVLGSPISQGGRVRGQIWKLSVPGNGTSKARETPLALGRRAAAVLDAGATGSRHRRRTPFSVDPHRQALAGGLPVQECAPGP